MYEFDEDVASRSKSFTVDMTDEPTSQLHQEKPEPSPQQSPKFRSSQASEPKNYAGFIDLEKMWIETQMLKTEANGLLHSQRSQESAFDKLAAEAGASHLSSLKYMSHMKSSTQHLASSSDQADPQSDNTFMNALKQSAGSVGSESGRRVLPNDATFINALKQSGASVGSLESSNNAGALQLYDNYMKIANMDQPAREALLNPSQLSSQAAPSERDLQGTQMS